MFSFFNICEILASKGPSSVEWNWWRTRRGSSTTRLYSSACAVRKVEGITRRVAETECTTKCCSWTGRNIAITHFCIPL